MAIRSREEIMTSLRTVIGENVSDDVIVLLEDVNDTLSVENNTEKWKEKYESANAEWEQKYNDNDKMWREKYRDRFYGDVDDTEDRIFDDVTKVEKPKEKYDDLFEEVK